MIMPGGYSSSMGHVHLVTTRRAFLSRFAALGAGAFALPLIQACAPAQPAAAPTTAPARLPRPRRPPPSRPPRRPRAAAATTAPAAVAAKPAADTGWDDMWKKAGHAYQGVTLRLPVGGRGHWGANEEASKDFEKLTGIKSVWENISDAQLFDKLFLDLTSQGRRVRPGATQLRLVRLVHVGQPPGAGQEVPG